MFWKEKAVKIQFSSSTAVSDHALSERKSIRTRQQRCGRMRPQCNSSKNGIISENSGVWNCIWQPNKPKTLWYDWTAACANRKKETAIRCENSGMRECWAKDKSEKLHPYKRRPACNDANQVKSRENAIGCMDSGVWIQTERKVRENAAL